MTTQTLALSDFLLARIAEDEEVIRFLSDAAPVDWSISGLPYTGLATMDAGCSGDVWYVVVDPKRALAECEAKRQIVGLHKLQEWGPRWGPDAGDICSSCSTPIEPITPTKAGLSEMVRYPCATLYALAHPYADHPDYREEWKP
jgi:hypothetical protein